MSRSLPVPLAPNSPALPSDLRSLIQEANIAIDAALVAAEMLATHAVVESLNYERIMDLLTDAQKAAQALQDAIDGA
jgi:hypothetical protein